MKYTNERKSGGTLKVNMNEGKKIYYIQEWCILRPAPTSSDGSLALGVYMQRQRVSFLSPFCPELGVGFDMLV